MPAARSEAQTQVKCVEAVKAHPNTKAVSLGPFKIWVSAMYLESKEFRDVVASNNGNKLADEVCGRVETYSAQKGKPWYRPGPKQAGKGKESEGRAHSASTQDKSKDTTKRDQKEPVPRAPWEKLEMQPIFAMPQVGAPQGEQVAPVLTEEHVDIHATGVAFTTMHNYFTKTRRFHRAPLLSLGSAGSSEYRTDRSRDKGSVCPDWPIDTR